MTRTQFLQAAAVAASPLTAQNAGRKPNVIVILADDLGCTDLGCYGASWLKTPNIDALAASGVRFTNWYSNASVCAPARAALMTGRYPARAGVPTNGPSLPASERTIAAQLRPAGYRTGLIGKWHLGRPPAAGPRQHGFDEFYGFHPGCVDFYSHRFYWGDPKVPNYHDLYRNETEIFEDGQYLTERLTQEAVSYVTRHAAQPFFLYLAYNAPHYPMHAPEKYVARFAGLPLEQRVYAAMISAVDDGVGELMRTLDARGLRDDTLIFFLGDNGATTEARAGLDGKPATAGSNRPYRGYKFSLFDGGMHVPGIVSWPRRIRAGQLSREVAMTMDVLPTACAAAGVAPPPERAPDGSSLVPMWTEGAATPHDAIFWAQGKQMAVRRGKWKLVVNGMTYDGSDSGRTALTGDDAMFLSDLDADPGESRNLRGANPALVDELSTLLHNWQQSIGKP